MFHHCTKVLVLHGFAFSIGLGGVMFFSKGLPPSPESSRPIPVAKPDRPQRMEAGVRLTSSASFRAAHADLVARSMTRSDRSACLEMLWQRWAETDPVGMLAFLDQKRVWPEDCKFNSIAGSIRPELLLDFALRHGSSDALRSLTYCDPLEVARLLAAIPEEERGNEIVALAKHVDLMLGKLGIPIKQPSPAYLRGAAETLLDQGRVVEFLDAFDAIEDPAEMKELAGKFGETLSEEMPSDEVLAWVLQLPDAYQMEAASSLMVRGDTTGMDFPEVRAAGKRQIESFAQAGLVEAAAAGVRKLFGEKPIANRGEEIAEWIGNFPPDGSWKPIADEVFRAWNDSDRQGMIRQICALPESLVREEMAMEAAQATIGNLAQPYDAEQQIIRDRLLDLFTDPQAKRRFEERFAPWSERSVDSDPFAPVDDPFAE
jgi:hypothetical protein